MPNPCASSPPKAASITIFLQFVGSLSWPAGRVHARQTLARARRCGGRAKTCHFASAARRQDRHGLSRLRPAEGELVSEGNVGLMQAVKRFELNAASASLLTRCGGFGRRFRICPAILVAR